MDNFFAVSPDSLCFPPCKKIADKEKKYHDALVFLKHGTYIDQQMP
jgi:hypothetical protein